MERDPHGNLFNAQDYITAPTGIGGLGFAPGSTGQYFFTNVKDATGARIPFNTPNGLVAAQGEWHVEKPLTAVQDQLSLRKQFGPHSLSIGGYFGYYTQDNRWFFTDILTDVRDEPHFLDLVVTPAGGGAPVNVTENGFRRYISNYVNGTGQTTILSGVIGGEVQLTNQLRADLGARVEYNDFVQHSENTSPFDLDSDSTTKFNNIVFGNNTFRHFTRSITDWSASIGLNYRVNDNFSVYSTAARGYKMPALDEFLNATAQEQVDLFDSREVQSGELGVKYATGRVGITVNGFYTKLKNIIGQGAVLDPVTGATTWRITTDPESRSYGAEIEALVRPIENLQLQGSTTILNAEQGPGIDSLVGVRLAGVPTSLGNLAAQYSVPGSARLQLQADLHYVGSRFIQAPRDRVSDAKLPTYAYVNFGVGFGLPGSSARFNIDLLNAFQSKGLEEGNPRLVGGSFSSVFFARPLLPRRLQASITYDFGGGPGPQTQQQ
jgi:outer membrane receptor protein involved in Fe transport